MFDGYSVLFANVGEAFERVVLALDAAGINVIRQKLLVNISTGNNAPQT